VRAGEVRTEDYVRLNRLVWSTQGGDALKTARYGSAQNSTFELGAEEVKCYNWPDITSPCYGRVQEFFFIVRPSPAGGESAVLLATVWLFTSVTVDPLTGLPLVDSSVVRLCIVLARHLNRRVLMPVVGATPPLLAQRSALANEVDKCSRALNKQASAAVTQRRLTALDVAREALARVDAELYPLQAYQRLVLGARASDQEADVPPASAI